VDGIGELAGCSHRAVKWLSLRKQGVGPRWALNATVALAGGSAPAAAITGAAWRSRSRWSAA
jgi:hypothetical protein